MEDLQKKLGILFAILVIWEILAVLDYLNVGFFSAISIGFTTLSVGDLGGIDVFPRPPGYFVADDFTTGQIEGLICAQMIGGQVCESRDWLLTDQASARLSRDNPSVFERDDKRAQWLIENGVFTANLGSANIHEGVRGKLTAVFKQDLTGNDFVYWIQLTQSDGLKVASTGSFQVGVDASTCSNIESKIPRGVISKIEFKSKFLNPNSFQIFVNGALVCSGLTTGQKNFIFSAQWDGDFGSRSLRIYPNPYINVPFQSCPTKKGEVFVVEKFDGGTRLKVGQDQKGFGFTVLRFCESTPILFATQGGNFADKDRSAEITTALAQGQSVDVFTGQEWVIPYKTYASEVLGSCTEDQFYNKQAGCISSPGDLLVSRIETLEDPEIFLQEAEFQSPAPKVITLTHRIYGDNTVGIDQSPTLFIGSQPLNVDIDTSDCGELPYEMSVLMKSGQVVEGSLNQEAAGCSKATIEFMGSQVSLQQGESRALGKNFKAILDNIEVDSTATFDQKGREKWTYKAFAELRLVQIDPIMEITDIDFDSQITLNKKETAQVSLIQSIPGLSGFDIFGRSSGLFPSEEPIEIFEYHALVGSNTIKLPLITTQLLGKEQPVDGWISLKRGEETKKFKTGAGAVLEYEVVAVAIPSLTKQGEYTEVSTAGIQDAAVRAKGFFEIIIDFFKKVIGAFNG